MGAENTDEPQSEENQEEEILKKKILKKKTKKKKQTSYKPKLNIQENIVEEQDALVEELTEENDLFQKYPDLEVELNQNIRTSTELQYYKEKVNELESHVRDQLRKYEQTEMKVISETYDPRPGS